MYSPGKGVKNFKDTGLLTVQQHLSADVPREDRELCIALNCLLEEVNVQR